MTNPHKMSAEPLAALLRGGPPAEGIAWEEVVALARRYGVSPLLFWRLRQLETSEVSIPDPVWAALRNDYYAAAAQAMVRERALVQVLTALDEAGVPVIVLKGAALAYTVYPGPALRSMCDLDLLVQREHLDRAWQALESAGYAHQPEPPQPFSPFNTEFTGETSFRHTTGRYSTLVELHWELFANEWFRRTVALDMSALWARAVPFQVGSTVALSLDPQDALAHVCLHLSLHGFAHLRGYVDIVQLAQSGQVDWDVFVDRVQQSRIRVACYFPLWQAKHVWDAPVPEKVLRALRPGHVRQRLGAWMVANALVKPNVGHAWEHVVSLFVVDRLRDLVRLGMWLFFPGPAWLRERYRLPSTGQARAWVAVHPLVVLREGLRSLAAVVSPASST